MPVAPAPEVIDLHSHVIAPDLARYPLAPMGHKQSDWSRERPVDEGGMVQAMDAAGVSRSVLVQASTCYGYDNRYVQDCAAANPQRFAGVFAVDIQAPDAVAAIDRWSTAGMVGARVFVAGHTNADRSIRLDAPVADAVWGALSERGVPVCVQIRADGLDQVRSVLERFPRLTVLMDHFARPDLSGGAPYTAARGLFELARFPNLYFKLTTHNVRECQQGASTPADFVRAVVGAFGAERIGWGSNFPASDGSLTGLVNEALHVLSSLSGADQARILSGTAKALYPQLAALPSPEMVAPMAVSV